MEVEIGVGHEAANLSKAGVYHEGGGELGAAQHVSIHSLANMLEKLPRSINHPKNKIQHTEHAKIQFTYLQNPNMLLRSIHPAIVPAFHGRAQIKSAAEGAISPENAQAKGPWNHWLSR